MGTQGSTEFEMKLITILAAFVVGVAATQVYGRYRATGKIAWASVIMGCVFIVIAIINRT
jgi:hypothetical protein